MYYHELSAIVAVVVAILRSAGCTVYEDGSVWCAALVYGISVPW